MCQKEAVSLTYLGERGEKLQKAIESVKSPLPKEEDFACLDHNHFSREYEKLLQKAEEIEFDVKCLLNLKKNSSEVEESYHMISVIIQEIEMKLNFLEKKKKIDPKSLVEDVHHFSGLLKNFTLRANGVKTEKYTDFYYETNEDNQFTDDDYKYYVVEEETDFALTDFKLSKGKKKKNKNNNKKKEGNGVAVNANSKTTALVLN